MIVEIRALKFLKVFYRFGDVLKQCNVLILEFKEDGLLSYQVPYQSKENRFEKAQQILFLFEVERVDGCRFFSSLSGFDNAERKIIESSIKQQKLFLKSWPFMPMFQFKMFKNRLLQRFLIGLPS